jgi:hypothetical protein
MATPPEVLFHRSFPRLCKANRDLYRGKADLDRLAEEPLPVTLLEGLQVMFNAALAAEKDVPQHVDHDPFYFDYIDSDEPNALAFCCDGYSFIGVTIPLLNTLWEAASRVGGSSDVATLFDIRLSDEQSGAMSVEQRIVVAVFRLQVLFIVLDEWTHVVHGHQRPRDDDAVFSNKIVVRENGKIERQAREADADGYAAYDMLENVISMQRRCFKMASSRASSRIQPRAASFRSMPSSRFQ